MSEARPKGLLKGFSNASMLLEGQRETLIAEEDLAFRARAIRHSKQSMHLVRMPML